MSEQEPYTPEECKPPYPIGTPKWAVWMQGKTEGIKVGRQSLEAELKSKDAEIARLREALEYLMPKCDDCGERGTWWDGHYEAYYCEKHADCGAEEVTELVKAKEILAIGGLMIVDGQPVRERTLSPIESGEKPNE